MTMDVNVKVGEVAGKVWHALESSGPLTVTQLKTKVNGENDLLNFALGWLAREDKVEISPEKKSFKIKLK